MDSSRISRLGLKEERGVVCWLHTKEDGQRDEWWCTHLLMALRCGVPYQGVMNLHEIPSPIPSLVTWMRGRYQSTRRKGEELRKRVAKAARGGDTVRCSYAEREALV